MGMRIPSVRNAAQPDRTGGFAGTVNPDPFPPRLRFQPFYCDFQNYRFVPMMRPCASR